MPLGLFLVNWNSESGGPDLMLQDGEDLAYTSGQVWIVDDNGDDVLADQRMGGWGVATEVPPDMPPNTQLVWLRSTDAMLTTLDARYQAADPILGLIGEVIADA